jgi:HAD superfamily hydrolase (TIGR01490 family)
MSRIAFFDLDKTLIPGNSATAWIRYELAAGRVSRLRAVQGLGWILRYSLGAVSIEEQMRSAVARVAGQREAKMIERVADFYEQSVRDTFRPGARAAIERHRAEGDLLVLLTSSSSYLSSHVARDLDLDEYLCNRLEVGADGRYTGRPVEPLCFKGGKVTLAKRLAESRGAELADAWFYSDSISDQPMLEAVGNPVAVHPDPRLRRLARKRGWPIVDWD